MDGAINALVGVDSGIDLESINSALPRESGVTVVGVVDGLDETWSTLQETVSDVLVIACAGESDRALLLIDGAVKQQPTRPVVVLTHGSPNGFLRRLFEAGADDVMVLPQTPDQVAFALRKAMARIRGGAAGSTSQGALVPVLGPKGGTGKTLTSTNLAVSLTALGKTVILIDLDLQFGDVGLCLGMSPEETIYDLVRAGGSMDEDKLTAYLTPHSSGVRALLAPSRPDHAGVVTVEFIRQVYETARRMADYVIVDTPPGFTPEVITTIDRATLICMVGMLDSLSLKNTKLGLETLHLMGIPSDHIRLVLNRAGSRVGITTEDVSAIVKRMPDVLVPSDREIPRAVNEGEPIVLAKPQSEAARSFRMLAEIVAGVGGSSQIGATPKKRKLLRARSN